MMYRMWKRPAHSAPQIQRPTNRRRPERILPGNQQLQRLLRQYALQAKLTVGQPDDEYEREADRVADQVMRMTDRLGGSNSLEAPAVRRLYEGEDRLRRQTEEGEEEEEAEEMLQAKAEQEAAIQRQVEPEEEEEEEREEEEEETIQAKRNSARPAPVAQGVEEQVRRLRGGGQPMVAPVRQFLEPRFGRDLGQVQVHTDAAAAGVARSLHARAFTLGNNIVFAAGQYRPDTAAGQRLLAHEVAHVIQQGAGETREVKDGI